MRNRSLKREAGSCFRRGTVMLAAVLLCCVGLMVPVSATSLENVPYSSYTYWEGPDRYEAVPMRAVYEADTRITNDTLGISPLKDAEFIALSQDQSELFIMDSGNGRIVVVDAVTFQFKEEIGQFRNGTETLSVEGACGLYISRSRDIYIADTEHSRVLIADRSGEISHIIECPKGNGIPNDLDFRPSRIVLDEKDYLYVVSEGCYYGMLVFDDQLTFLGFHGTYPVETDILSMIRKWITGLFMTNEKNASSQKKLPAEVLDVTIDHKGFLYSLSSNSAGQIKRLGLNGNQTLFYKFGFSSKNGDSINFGENPSSFWHNHYQYQLILSAITVDNDGFIYAIDSGRSRIFMYDEECRIISVFSNGYSEGNQIGTFITPISIACGNDRLYVLDFVYGSVTVFRLTDYGRSYKSADLLTMAGEYEKAQPIWESVLKEDANNQRAYEGIAKAFLSQKNYREAMRYAERGSDQQTYSLAFEVVQKEFLQRNFRWIFLLGLLVVIGLGALLVVSKKKKLFHIPNPKLRAALSASIHPIQSFQQVKYKQAASVGLAVLWMMLYYVSRVSSDLYGGFMYVITPSKGYNALYTLLSTVGLILLWSITNWGICILSDGKGSLKEVFTVSAYAFMPMIVYSVIFLFGSHLIPASGSDVFSILSAIAVIYTILLLLLGMSVVHEYSFFKAVAMAVLTVLGMILVTFVIFSVWLLAQQFIVFIERIVNEAMLR